MVILLNTSITSYCFTLYTKIHAGQAVTMFMAPLIRFPQIHHEIVLLIAQRSKSCTAIVKNLKPLIPKNLYTKPNSIPEPNEELQLDFT